jgi:16S rRNA (guanine1516-N2)-methyltransferase
LKLNIDFDASGPDYRRKALRGGAEILARALGGLASHRRVLDLSAGLGQDAVFMAQMGFHVTALERDPLLAFLLSEARARTRREDLEHLRFHHADARDWLVNANAEVFDVAYFDPMYPEKKKSALPRQEMRLFRELVGDDSDAAEVLEQARRGPWRRVVVKRPLKAEELASGVRNRFEGHSVRYDVYVKESR